MELECKTDSSIGLGLATAAAADGAGDMCSFCHCRGQLGVDSNEALLQLVGALPSCLL
jgi:hypothetical protein